MKNDDLKVEKKSKKLEGKTIALCVTGGIASIETPKIARALRRHGAKVKAYMTDASQKFIGKTTMEWATEDEVTTKLSGKAEHICLEDLVLIAPSTANTISKISNGISDSTVTTLVASALGQKKPVYIAPTFHKSLGDNPIFVDNLTKLLKHNVKVIEPRDDEGKYKIARTENILTDIVRELSEDPLKGKKVLITAGPTRGKIDAVRYVSNHSSGKLGLELAKELHLRGADVKVIYGPGKIKFPNYIDKTDVITAGDMLKETMNELEGDYDIAIFAAAVLDYEPSEYIDEKTRSGKEMNITLKPTKKIIKEVDKLNKRIFKVGFKLEYAKNEADLKKIGFESLMKNKCNLVIANDLTKIDDKKHKAYLITPEKGYTPVENKKNLVEKIAEELGRRATATFYMTKIQKPSSKTEEHYEKFYEIGKELSERNLLPKYGQSSFGNMSIREGNSFIITSRKSDKAELKIEDLIEITKIDHKEKIKYVNGNKKPSSDLLVHNIIYKALPEINAIIHVHDDKIVQKANKLGLPVTDSDYPCGSLEAAKEAIRTIKRTNSRYIIMKNHGILALGKNLEEAKCEIYNQGRHNKLQC